MGNALTPLHVSYLEKLTSALEKDSRFEALLAIGSLAQKQLDKYSDLDLVLVVKELFYKDVISKRYTFAAQLGNLLSAFSGTHRGDQRLLICLYGPQLLHVDLHFFTFSDLSRLCERPKILWSASGSPIQETIQETAFKPAQHSDDWFELRAWMWLHEASARYLRGELYSAIDVLSTLRETVLAPMLQRKLGTQFYNTRKLDMQPEPFNKMLASTLAVYSRESVYSALMSSMRLYLELREDSPPPHPVNGMPERIEKLLQAKAYKPLELPENTPLGTTDSVLSSQFNHAPISRIESELALESNFESEQFVQPPDKNS